MSEIVTTKIPQSADEKLDLILTTVLSMTVRVDSMDSRLQKVVEDVAQLQGTVQGGFQRVDEGQEVVRTEVEALKSSVNYRFMILSGEVQASYRSLERRVTCMELNRNPPNSQT